ncbi:peptidoglycan binding protein CsiV [Sansalvadorimonas sp. 2012CJ34-2]|uniref:Peptidoglycan binding protein CsiV n=1 Tax=Parendozoicomonas callyspongiae TaxID=2942213 RepID=A0ABT0PEX2_9GAMM|nr:CsiV family protein [Sansalvadorimonas sp. 2012CJ34-2]MCL6269811.1 peptidoglycan binding protein CsiV [Sansalvadorimonas sp. 2012CJ34-2]
MALRASFICGLLFAATCSASAVSAQTLSATNQEDSAQEWYQFDILLFSQKSQSSTKEHPPALTEHKFPLNAVNLYTSEQLTVKKEFLPTPGLRVEELPPPQAGEIIDQETVEVTSGTAVPQEILGNPTPLAAPVIEQQNSAPFEYYEDSMVPDDAELKPEAQQPELVDRKPNLATEAFILLPDSLSGLKAENSSLRRAKDYKVLWKASFRMPLDRDRHPVPIKIEAGRKVGHTYQVEGTISLSQKRFLHADTDLWVNTLNPVRPVEEVLAGDSVLIPLSIEEAYAIQPPVASDDLPETLVNIFPYTENMPVKSSKRLQLSKLNFIDHPDIGILIKVTPYKLPELEAELTPVSD